MTTAPKNVLILVGDFVETLEAFSPHDCMICLGHNVHTICPGKKAGDYVDTAVHDFVGHQTYNEKPGHRFAINFDLDDVDVTKYDGLVLPGGRAPEYLRLNEKVLELVVKFNEAKKPIAAICHGAQILTAIPDILKGRKISAYPACEPEVKLAGAEYQKIEVNDAITDGNFVTAPAWPANGVWMRQFAALL